jgi:5-dehydro-2-deoxygluconokinase
VFPGDIPDDIEKGIRGPGFPVEVFNVLGAGDAFMSGFLRGWLRDESWETCAKFANACGALAVSRHGCTPAIPSWAELSYFLERGSDQYALRKDETLNHVHWATTRRREWPALVALAIDHRAQFEEMVEEFGGDASRVGDFKKLVIRALDRVADGRPGFGTLLDGRYGKEALHSCMDGRYWVGRPVELPGSRPLRFEAGANIAGELLAWPADQVVKCLVFYHPDDPDALKREQEETVVTLFEACRQTGHELLLEIISSTAGPIDSQTTARAMQSFYDLGVKPDWWKLEPAADDAAWHEIGTCIERNDPLCRGILVLGLDAPMEDLIASFESIAPQEWVKGFAIGRTVFGDAARAWLAGKIDDAAAVDRMSSRFGRLVEAWGRLRGS